MDATGLAPRDERARLARALRATRLDSLVSILYRARGALRPHVDHGLEGLGLAVSLGSSCEFRYGDEIVELRSGDALFGSFGSVARRVEINVQRLLDGVELTNHPTHCFISTGRTRGRVDAPGGHGSCVVAAPARGAGARWRDLALWPRAVQFADPPGTGSTARVVGLTRPPCDA